MPTVKGFLVSEEAGGLFSDTAGEMLSVKNGRMIDTAKRIISFAVRMDKSIPRKMFIRER
jgi:hypothetical protein